MIFGVTSGSNAWAAKKGVSKRTQVKFEKPSTGATPGWDTRPLPSARFLAYANDMPASSTIQDRKSDACSKKIKNGRATGSTNGKMLPWGMLANAP
jgi:hypothetical protein